MMALRVGGKSTIHVSVSTEYHKSDDIYTEEKKSYIKIAASDSQTKLYNIYTAASDCFLIILCIFLKYLQVMCDYRRFDVVNSSLFHYICSPLALRAST